LIISRNNVIFISGGDEVVKKSLSNAVDEEIIRQFKAACALSNKKMNEVLEELMQGYVEQVAKKNPE
jgi:tRNA A-37 threonylcarbamoyl transferase component Bud32